MVLTVTHRPGGRDSVAISAGYAYPRNAEVTFSVGQTNLAFYTGGNSAFARDGAAVVAVMRGGNRASSRGPGAGGPGRAAGRWPGALPGPRTQSLRPAHPS